MRHLFLTTLLLLSAASARAALVVESVIPDSPAEAAGLEAGDYILQIAGQKIKSLDDLHAVTSTHQGGDRVPVVVRRDGEELELPLTFAARRGGGVSIGVRLEARVEPTDEPTTGMIACLAWVDETYHVETLMQRFGLDLSSTYETIRACIERDARRMTSDMAIKNCDNIFKVHCSGLDLITELGEAQVERCAESLRESLGLKLDQYPGWKTCSQHKVFDSYAQTGEADDAACQGFFLDECGTSLAAVIETDQLSPEQQAFLECCSVGAIAEAGDERCGMIDSGFSRGPCHDRPACINRLTNEWIPCSVLAEEVER